MALNPDIVEAVANSNFKTLAEQVATNIANQQRMGMENATAHQNRLNLIAEASVGQILNRMNGLDTEEAMAISQVTKADLAKNLADLSSTVAAMQGQLGGVVAAIQQMTKTAQTTPPPTA